jgi:hypothetical protein
MAAPAGANKMIMSLVREAAVGTGIGLVFASIWKFGVANPAERKMAAANAYSKGDAKK